MKKTFEAVGETSGVLAEREDRGVSAPGGWDEGATRRAVVRFKALGDSTRLRLLIMLAESDEPLCVCELNAAFDLEQPTVSHHLKVLRKAGLVSVERRGTWAYYCLRADAADWLRMALRELPG